MNIFKVNHKVRIEWGSSSLLLSLILVLSGCTVDTTQPPAEPVESVETTPESTQQVTAPKENPVTVVPAEPKPTQSAPKEGTTDQIPVTLVSTTDGLSP